MDFVDEAREEGLGPSNETDLFEVADIVFGWLQVMAKRRLGLIGA
jgi:hypothetical protein